MEHRALGLSISIRRFLPNKTVKAIPIKKAYQDKIAGARFLEFLRKRLLVLRELLADDGSIYVHLDWRTIHDVKVLCDEFFSERRFLNKAVWFYRRWSSGSDQFQRQHETLLIYSKGNSPVFNVLYEPYTEGPWCMDHPEGYLIIVFFNTGDNLDAT